MKRAYWLLATILIPAILQAQSTKLAPELQHVSGTGSISVIVQYKSVPPATQMNAIQLRNGKVFDRLSVVNGIKAIVPASSLPDLAADPRVAYVSPDRPVHSSLNNAAPSVQANYAWALGLDGTRVGIAVVDSGVHQVDDIALPGGGSRVLASFDFTGEGTDDFYGHGTHVAGIIGATARTRPV